MCQSVSGSPFLSLCLYLPISLPTLISTQEVTKGFWTPNLALCHHDLTFSTSAGVFVADLPQVRSLRGQVVEGAAAPGCETTGAGLGLAWAGRPGAGCPPGSAPSVFVPRKPHPPGPAQPLLNKPHPLRPRPCPLHSQRATPNSAQFFLSSVPNFSRTPTTRTIHEGHAPYRQTI